ncbi:hypothetical protein [Microvirga lotononidis]|uniref:Uncharacterized protein n=1 Tax=Microvirga lotononidis TaxID=864069 RepID=I4YP29_9HYPH|nr:hypothetical protein [Microvirga lotononidis]EIM25721.1 hypothetical protein MicloDRAFT_00064480 [Microvirga lotononidis]WQO25655.1 hypothetical protein U0023_13105 [Microvirga lotononidis]
MTMLAELVKALAATGATVEQIAAAVEAVERQQIEQDEARKAAKRAGNAERQRRFKERKKQEQVTNSNADNALSDVTSVVDSLSDKERSPTPSKEINSPSSETNVSGVAAPISNLAENVIVLADPRGELFSRGLKLLAGLTGKPDGKLRGLLGKWLKDANDDAVRVLRVIEDAGRNRVADAVPWIEAALKQQAQPKRQETHSERARRLNATWI